jgi:hypothetical protein
MIGINFDINVGRVALELKFDLKLGRLHWGKISRLLLGGCAACETCSTTWVLVRTNSEFILGPRKPTESLDRVGRSQEIPDAN